MLDVAVVSRGAASLPIVPELRGSPIVSLRALREATLVVLRDLRRCLHVSMKRSDRLEWDTSGSLNAFCGIAAE